MKIELCDLCGLKEPDKRFKVKMSRKGGYVHTDYGIAWEDFWNPYEKICICEDCGEKLFGIKTTRTRMQELIATIQKGGKSNE